MPNGCASEPPAVGAVFSCAKRGHKNRMSRQQPSTWSTRCGGARCARQRCCSPRRQPPKLCGGGRARRAAHVGAARAAAAHHACHGPPRPRHAAAAAASGRCRALRARSGDQDWTRLSELDADGGHRGANAGRLRVGEKERRQISTRVRRDAAQCSACFGARAPSWRRRDARRRLHRSAQPPRRACRSVALWRSALGRARPKRARGEAQGGKAHGALRAALRAQDAPGMIAAAPGRRGGRWRSRWENRQPPMAAYGGAGVRQLGWRVVTGCYAVASSIRGRAANGRAAV